MNLELGLVAACLIVFCCAAGAVIFLSGLSHARTAAWLGALAPATRANVLLAWAALPLLTGLATLLFVLAPSIAHALGLGADHCHVHDHHTHLCVVHTPWLTGSPLEQLILAGAGAAMLAWVLGTGLRLHSARQSIRLLLALGRASSEIPDCHTVQSARPFAVTAGLLRPRVLLSSRLLEELEASEVATVVCHEQTHQRRRDGLRLLAADVLTRLHLPGTRRLIVQELRLATEQACDEVAARQSGDRLQVAELIIKLTRLAGNPPVVAGPTCASFTGAETVRRVEELLRPARLACSWLGPAAAAATACLVALGLFTSDAWHHAAESFFGNYLG